MVRLALLVLATASGALAQSAGSSGASSPGGGGGGAGTAPPPAPLAGLLSKLDVGASLIAGAGRGARDKLAGGLEAVLGALLDNNLGDNSFLKPAGVFDFGPGGAASVAYPAGNLRALTNFASGLKTAASAKDMAGLADAVDGLVDGLCTPEVLAPPVPVPARCAFPEVELRLVPGECQYTLASGELACRPPFITLERRPAFCSLPHLTAPTWVGKNCAPVAQVGPEINYALGYAPYNISVDPAFVAPLADALTGPLREAGASIEGKLAGLKKIMPGFLGGGGGGGGAGAATSNVAVAG